MTEAVAVEQEQEKKKGPSVAVQLVKLADNNDCIYWHCPDKRPYVSVMLDNSHIVNWRLKSREFEAWLKSSFFKQADEKFAAGSSAVSDCLGILEGFCMEGRTMPKYARLAPIETGGQLIDLCDDTWQSVEINAKGWKVLDSCATLDKTNFVRLRGQAPLPTPKPGTPDHIARFFELVGIDNEETRTLVTGFLLGALRPKGPYPVLLVRGLQGSGKSTLCEYIRQLIDPNTVPLRALSKTEHDFAVSCTRSRVLAIDNVSQGEMPEWFSDAVCRAATGGGFSARELYSDDEEVLLSVCLPIIINGIDEIAHRGDLLDRAIILDLPSVDKSRRKTREQLDAEFETLKPYVLGALYSAQSCAYKHRATTTLAELPRMADFALWIEAASSYLGWERGYFAKKFNDNQKDAKLALLESHSLGGAIMQALPGIEAGLYKELTATDMLKNLGVYKPEGHAAKFWPQTPNSLGSQLRRLAPSLEQAGVKLVFGRDGHSGTRRISLEFAKPAT